jgi:colanic acid biosynthesis glycosyl transferase WcaI
VSAPLPHHGRRLLVVAQFYWPELIGSAPYCTEMAEWMAAQGADVQVVAARPHYPRISDFPEWADGSRDVEDQADVDIRRAAVRERTDSGAKARILSEASFLANALALLGRGRLRRERNVVAFCPSILSIMLGRVLTRRRGTLVGVVHDIQSGLARGLGMGGGRLIQTMRFTERHAFNRCDALIVLSEQMRDELLDIGVRRPIHILPIWTDIDEIRPRPRPDGPPTVLYSGNLGRKQGLDQVLDMAALLASRAPEARIVIRGDGGERDALAEDAARRGLVNVVFEPLVPRARFAEALSEATVHLVPQDPEGADFAVPSKVYSILAAGRPFVCTAGAGTSLADLEPEVGGFRCVPPGDAEAFCDAVAGLLAEPEQADAMGARGREWVVANASADAILSRYAALAWP